MLIRVANMFPCALMTWAATFPPSLLQIAATLTNQAAKATIFKPFIERSRVKGKSEMSEVSQKPALPRQAVLLCLQSRQKQRIWPRPAQALQSQRLASPVVPTNRKEVMLELPAEAPLLAGEPRHRCHFQARRQPPCCLPDKMKGQ